MAQAPGDSRDAGRSGPDASAADVGPDDAGPDDVGTVDASAPDAEAEADVVVATGVWENRGYAVRGTSDIVRLADGRYEIRMSEDFAAANLPGPTLFFSDRDRIGRTGVQTSAGDVLIGLLDDVTGPLVFEIPPEAAQRRFAWIYCEPFSVEMHRAELVAP